MENDQNPEEKVVAVKISPTEEMPNFTRALRGIIAELAVVEEKVDDKPA
ncbi:hypothetical protein [Paenibacillus periandrae]|nr:hypothetical protein [Paenibacillus periandrae]